jgi:4-carboxymuconolactone decarboxylase
MLRGVSERYTPLSPESLTPEQTPVYDAIAAARNGSVPKPFHVLLQSPELTDRAQQLGALLRYRTGLPARLSELAILVTAKHWDARYEWSVHEGEARKAGVPEDVIRAIAAGIRPALAGDDAVVYDFAASFYANRDVPDAVFSLAVERFGEKTVVELASILGYYSMLAIVMSIYRVTP